MSKVGAHLFIWTSVIDRDILRVFNKVKEMGFDGIEIPLINPMGISSVLVEKMRNELDRINLECTCGGGLGRGESLIDEDKATREKGKKYLRRFIELCSDLGSDTLGGVLYGAFEVLKGRAKTKGEWQRAVEGLSEMADYAKERNVTACIEPLNRYETYFLNTAEETVRLLKDVGKKNLKYHLDTFHMNIEEKDFYTPVIQSKEYVGHVHCCASDRGVPGTGHVDWNGLFKGLSEISYNGWLVIETFYGPIRELPVVSSVWRQLADSVDDIARGGLRFIREKIKEYNL